MSLEFCHEGLVFLQLADLVVKTGNLSLDTFSLQVAGLLINPNVSISDISDKLGIQMGVLQLLFTSSGFNKI